MDQYHYTESGLDNVYIENMKAVVDDAGETVYEIPYVNELHKVIACAIVEQAAAMSPKELRFLRTELGLTQAELAQIVHTDEQTIRRWEQGRTPVNSSSEIVIRMLASEMLELHSDGVRDMAAKCVQSAETTLITIDGSDPENYRPVAA